MSMSTRVQGLREKDDTYKKMESILLLCKELKVKVPNEVYEYFELINEEYCSREIITSLPIGSVEHYTEDSDDVWEVDLSLIPKDITKLRFVNSY